MEFGEKESRIGIIVGYAFSYSVFTTVLFFALTLLHKMPQGWSAVHVILLTAIVTCMAYLTRWWLT